MRLSVDQLFHGLYSAPTRVIGIPGMTDHQQRINRYYGVENPSTLPTAERVAARRCFAEALSLVLADRQRAADNRLIFPFVECLPLCVQCAICAMRPAEVSGKRDEEPLCAICATRRQQSDARQPIPTRQALIAVSTPAVERHLLNQPTPAAYQQASAQIDQTWVQAIREAEKRQAHLLWRTDSTAWLICPPNSVLQVTARLCTALGSALPASAGQIAASVAFSDQSGDNARLLSDIAHPDHDSATDGDATIRLVSSDARYRSDSDRLHYSTETLERLAEAAARLNGDLWRDLPVGTLRHLSGLGSLQATALAYEQFRAQLTAEQRQSLDELIRPLERTWGIATARFFQALGDAQLVADQMRLTTQSTADNAR